MESTKETTLAQLRVPVKGRLLVISAKELVENEH